MLRLGSVVEYGFGPNTGAISLIYSFLLEKYSDENKMDILVNHIGDDLQEQIVSHKNQIGVNIRYPLPSDFNSLGAKDKNFYFTEIINEALLRINTDRKIWEVEKLDEIKTKIVDNNFSIEVPYKNFPVKNNNRRVVKISINPHLEKFDFYLSLVEDGMEKCRLQVYSGLTTNFYFADLFFYGKWKGENKILISGKRSEIQISFSIDECNLEFLNSGTIVDKAPMFEFFKATSDKDKNLKDYIDSLNPGLPTAIIHQL